MPTLPNELLQWLYRVIQIEYIDPRAAYQDVAISLQTYPTLKPRTRVFTNEVGDSKLLLNLYGSLPCQISGKVYKIPIEIWIAHEYPLVSPIVYVVPTEKMLLQPGNHVDNSGKCYHPYLASWQQNPNEPSNIVKLCNELSKVFSLEPPVFAKPIDRENAQNFQNFSSHSSNSATPVPAQYPKESYRDSPLSPPPLPPLPEDLRKRIIVSPTQEKVHIQQRNKLIDQPNIMDNEFNSNGSEDLQRLQVLHDMNDLIQKLYDENISRDLNKFKANINQIKTSIDKFDKIFEYEFHNLDKINNQLKENEVILIDSIEKADDTITNANKFGELNVDEIICAETIVHNQLYNLVAEELAITDTIYALTKAFDNGKIPLSSFMRHTRNLAREQFLKKALIEKIADDVLKLS